MATLFLKPSRMDVWLRIILDLAIVGSLFALPFAVLRGVEPVFGSESTYFWPIFVYSLFFFFVCFILGYDVLRIWSAEIFCDETKLTYKVFGASRMMMLKNLKNSEVWTSGKSLPLGRSALLTLTMKDTKRSEVWSIGGGWQSKQLDQLRTFIKARTRDKI